MGNKMEKKNLFIKHINKQEFEWGLHEMKKQNVGFAFLMLGLIFAVTVESILWYIGVALGLVGLGIVMANSKGDK